MIDEFKRIGLKGLILIGGMIFLVCSGEQSSFIEQKHISNDQLFLSCQYGEVEDITTISVVEENTLLAVTPLFIPQSQVLGSLIGPVNKEVFLYTVEDGDTISSIAEKFNISTQTILWANNSPSRIKKGQDLVILPVTGTLHYVRQGETISAIASLYKADQEKILSFNEIEGSIVVGDVLVIPDGQMPVNRPATITSSSASGFIAPARGVISQGLHPHNAIDIANKCHSTPIYASASGTVQRTGFDFVGGNYIRILHNGGVVTYYGHLSRILVSPGQAVAQGAVIGYMGNTGFTIGATGCHIHFEVRGATNPLSRYRVGSRI